MPGYGAIGSVTKDRTRIDKVSKDECRTSGQSAKEERKGGSIVKDVTRPAHYQIRVDGLLFRQWSEWFGGMEITNQGGETILSGTLDQPALHGVLERVRDLGLCVIAVRRLNEEE
jgi:hypothetical protein